MISRGVACGSVQRKNSQPVVKAIQELLVGRAGGRVVMNAGPLHVRPVPPGGCIVHGQQHALAADQPHQQQHPQTLGQGFGLASQGLKEVVIVGEVVADLDGPQPARDGSPPARKHHSQENQRQPPATATVQSGGQPFDPLLPFLRRLIRNHPWLSLRAATSVTAA